MLVGNVIIDRHVVEIPAGQSSPVSNDNGPDPGATAVEGGGGGFLSNEIAYRVTRLRDAVNPSVPAGHIHTPALGLPGAGVDDPGFAAQRSSIVAQYRAILNAAITA
jgi:pyrrolidone-carboxylate peptidase